MGGGRMGGGKNITGKRVSPPKETTVGCDVPISCAEDDKKADVKTDSKLDAPPTGGDVKDDAAMEIGEKKVEVNDVKPGAANGRFLSSGYF